MESIVDSVKYWNYLSKKTVCILVILVLLLDGEGITQPINQQPQPKSQARQRINFNEDWRFMRYALQPDNLLVILPSKKNKPGSITITATSPGLKSTTVEIKSK